VSDVRALFSEQLAPCGRWTLGSLSLRRKPCINTPHCHTARPENNMSANVLYGRHQGRTLCSYVTDRLRRKFESGHKGTEERLQGLHSMRLGWQRYLLV